MSVTPVMGVLGVFSGVFRKQLKCVLCCYSSVLSVFVKTLLATCGTSVTDRSTGRSKGFGFVEMGSVDEADKAISELNEREIEGRKLNVSEARPKESSPREGGGFNRGGGGMGRY